MDSSGTCIIRIIKRKSNFDNKCIENINVNDYFRCYGLCIFDDRINLIPIYNASNNSYRRRF
jgi:hypothetical protein